MAEDMVATPQNKAETLEGLEKNNEVVINEYIDSDPFFKFMDDHDDRVRPSVFTSSWVKALEAVVAHHPGMFEPSQIPSPFSWLSYWPPLLPLNFPWLLTSRRRKEQRRQLEIRPLMLCGLDGSNFSPFY